MNLIGNVKYIENSLSGRKSNQGRDKAAPKQPHPVSEKIDDKAKSSFHCSSEYDPHLGKLLDITA
jgi:hypothetical protein